MIVFAHLLNDQSGSPLILKSSINALLNDSHDLRLFVGESKNGAGALDNLTIATTYFWYTRSKYRILNLLNYIISQYDLFVKLMLTSDIEKNAIIYVNTLLPIGAAIFGKITKRKVIYHLHEISITPWPLKWLLLLILRNTACRVIYVSKTHKDQLPIKNIPNTIIYNPLSVEFRSSAFKKEYQHQHNGKFRVLMLASLRDYKGVPEFLSLASELISQQDIHFELVLNSSKSEKQYYFKGMAIPKNVSVFPRTTVPGKFYTRASLVVNLSRPDLWIETFGMTILEALAYGIPVIAPPIGGPTELVENGVEGFTIDSRDKTTLSATVAELANNPKLCIQMSKAAREKSKAFTMENFSTSLKEAISDLTINSGTS